MQWRKIGAGIATTITVGAGGVYGADVRQNPYEDKGTHYELPIKSDIPQGERVEIAKDRAAMTLKGWNDEYAITVIPQIPGVSFGAGEKIDRSFTTHADRPLLSKKMEYRSGNVTAFIEPKEGTENEFDIDFTLDAKPETNVFEYRIEGAEEFDFFYQPELTAEEIADGAERPENVVGSYAVYHKEKANYRVGSTNYATGKAFHIYRPKAIDADGAEVWAELAYADGTLSVSVPQEWLEKAAYPVRVDPTFGYTGIGNSSINLTINKQAASPFTLAEDGTVTAITFYGRASDDNIKTLIYTNKAGPDPDVLEVVGGFSFVPFVLDWYETSVSNEPLTANDYWIGAVTNGSTFSFNNDAVFGQGRVLDGSYASPANPWNTSGDVQEHDRYSIYATYTAAAPPAAAPSDDGVVWFE